MLPPLGLTGTTRPPYAARCSICITAPPEEVARSPAPTTAMLRGAKNGERSRFMARRCSTAEEENKMADPIELMIKARAHELGPGFAVRRVLPSAKRRMVGPF